MCNSVIDEDYAQRSNARKKIFCIIFNLVHTAHMNGEELSAYRKRTNSSLEQIAKLLGVSHSAVSRWEDGQEIPGPSAKLLDLLINGVQPFNGVGGEHDAAAEDKHFWKLRLTLDQWHELEARASKAGFSTVRDYLLAMIQEHLDATRTPGVIPFESAKEDATLRVAETPPAYGRE